MKKPKREIISCSCKNGKIWVKKPFLGAVEKPFSGYCHLCGRAWKNGLIQKKLSGQ